MFLLTLTDSRPMDIPADSLSCYGRREARLIGKAADIVAIW